MSSTRSKVLGVIIAVEVVLFGAMSVGAAIMLSNAHPASDAAIEQAYGIRVIDNPEVADGPEFTRFSDRDGSQLVELCKRPSTVALRSTPELECRTPGS